MGLISLFTNPINFFFVLVAILVAITVHEFMHAWTANYLGDPTSRYAGRVTLNPIAHLDLVGTIMLVIAGFGWGKPVPVNVNNFQNPKLGSVLTSIAGPMSNLLVALVFSFIYKLGAFTPFTMGGAFLYVLIYINLVLMLFNLIPIPPLDGSKIFAPIFPRLEDPRLQIYGIFIILGIVFFGWSYLSAVINFLMRVLIGV